MTPLEAFHLLQGELNKIIGQHHGDFISWRDKAKTLLHIIHHRILKWIIYNYFHKYPVYELRKEWDQGVIIF